MAKYYFEKWSYKVNRSIFDDGNTTTTVTGLLILETGEVTGSVFKTFKEFAIGDIILEARGYTVTEVKNLYNDNDNRFMVLKVEDRKSLRKRLTKQAIKNAITKDVFIENIIADESEYPANGIQGDYWYVRGDKAFPSLRLNDLIIGGAKIKDSTGQVRTVGNVYFKDSSGIVRNLR